MQINDIKKLARIGLIASLTLGSFTAMAAESILEKAYQKAGADRISKLEITASGKWFQFGQSPAPGTPWPEFTLNQYNAAFNFDTASARIQQNRIQVVEAGRERPAPVEQKIDQYVSGTIAWNLAAPQGSAPGTAPVAQAQSIAVEERQAEIWTTPQGFLKAAQKNNAVLTNTAKGTQIEFAVKANKYQGIINKEGNLEQVQTWIDNPVLGDTSLTLHYSNYKDFGGVWFPGKIVRHQGDAPVLDLSVSGVKTNTEFTLDVPADIKVNPKTPVAVTSSTLAPGIYYLQGGSHHSVAIEQKDHVVIVEAPQHEERSLAVIAKVKELIPNKKITQLINTHQHFDHSGGLRTYVDAGATIVTHELNKPFYEKAWKQPRSINPDKLALSKKNPVFKTFTDKLVLNDGARNIEIHSLPGNGHNDAFAFVYLPAEKILIEADAFTPPAPNAPVPTSVNPFSSNLYQNIQKLKLNVEQIAPLHGRLVKLDDLKSFINIQH